MLLAPRSQRRGDDRSGVGARARLFTPCPRQQSLLAEPKPSVGSVPGDQLHVAPLFRDPPALEHDDQIHSVEVDQANLRDAGAREFLGDEGADTAGAGDAHP